LNILPKYASEGMRGQVNLEGKNNQFLLKKYTAENVAGEAWQCDSAPSC
jgi:hypothetical protein